MSTTNKHTNYYLVCLHIYNVADNVQIQMGPLDIRESVQLLLMLWIFFVEKNDYVIIYPTGNNTLEAN